MQDMGWGRDAMHRCTGIIRWDRNRRDASRLYCYNPLNQPINPLNLTRCPPDQGVEPLD